MKLLLDTCTFLWFVSGDAKLSPRAADLATDSANDLFLSFASCWELSVKYGTGKLKLHQPPDVYVPDTCRRHGIAAVPIAHAACLTVHRLPPLHRDPFDRMLVCQALLEGMTILTPDPKIRRYPVATEW